MSSQGSFTAQVRAFAERARTRMDAVHRASAQRVIEVMQTPRAMGGNLRVDTGFLRASLVVTTSNVLPAVTFKTDGVGSFTYDGGQASLVIAGAGIRDPITAAYTANYARPREYGSRGQPGDGWVRLAAQQWPRIVREIVAEVRAADR